MAADARVAVVVATHNRRETLLGALARLRRLPEQPAILVVDNASTDGTADAVRRAYPDVRLIELDRNLGAGARTAGVHEADAPYVAFADDDSWWAPGSLTRTANVLERHRDVGLVAARILVGPEEREDPTCAAMAGSALRGTGDAPGKPVLGFVACGAIVRRSAFLEVGGFDARLAVYGEEQMLAVDLVRRGWRLVYLPDVVAHHHPSSQRDPAQRSRLEARNALWFAWLRRRGRGAAETTIRVLRHARRDPAARAGVREALRGLAWVVRERRPVSPELEAALRAAGA